jgi:hypothetical protein
MPATTIGTTGLQFGMTSETIGLVQSYSETRNVEKNEVRNQTGDVVGIAFFNATTAYSLSFNATCANFATTAGAPFAVLANALSIGTGTTRVDSITVNKSNDAFVTIEVSATGYPNLS